MLDAFASTGGQLVTGYHSGLQVHPAPPGEIRSLVVCAMGGSAAAADVVASAFADVAPVPILVVRGYRLPPFCGRRDLVACVTYSGGTEETVAAYREALQRRSPTVAVCTGGALAEVAGQDPAATLVRIPAVAPVPRAGLGVLTGGILGALDGAGVLPGAGADVEEAARVLEDVGRASGPERAAAENEAKQVADWVGDRIPVVWGSEGVSAAAAWRWKAAFNENAEVPSFASSLPELDHHEIVGWLGGHGKSFRLVILREDGEHPRVQDRLDATLDEVAGSGLEWHEVRARGTSPLSRAMSLALLGDLASTYHALARGVDPAAMDALDRVKRRLARTAP